VNNTSCVSALEELGLATGSKATSVVFATHSSLLILSISLPLTTGIGLLAGGTAQHMAFQLDRTVLLIIPRDILKTFLLGSAATSLGGTVNLDIMTTLVDRSSRPNKPAGLSKKTTFAASTVTIGSATHTPCLVLSNRLSDAVNNFLSDNGTSNPSTVNLLDMTVLLFITMFLPCAAMLSAAILAEGFPMALTVLMSLDGAPNEGALHVGFHATGLLAFLRNTIVDKLAASSSALSGGNVLKVTAKSPHLSLNGSHIAAPGFSFTTLAINTGHLSSAAKLSYPIPSKRLHRTSLVEGSVNR
jgi:hypothetical protein